MGKLITSHVYPPIPDRSFDWCAYVEGDEEAGKYGYGATERQPRVAGANYPERNGIYTIRRVVIHSWTGEALLLLDEVRNGPGELYGRGYGCEPGFDVIHFRPLVTRTQEQDISEHFSGFLHETRRAPERVG